MSTSTKKHAGSTKNIAARLGHDKDTINYVLAALKATLDTGSPSRKKASGRPSKITEKLLVALKRQINKYPAMTTIQLSKDGISDGLQSPVSSPETSEDAELGGCSQASVDIKN
jgi:hypothetical protein